MLLLSILTLRLHKVGDARYQTVEVLTSAIALGRAVGGKIGLDAALLYNVARQR